MSSTLLISRLFGGAGEAVVVAAAAVEAREGRGIVTAGVTAVGGTTLSTHAPTTTADTADTKIKVDTTTEDAGTTEDTGAAAAAAATIRISSSTSRHNIPRGTRSNSMADTTVGRRLRTTMVCMAQIAVGRRRGVGLPIIIRTDSKDRVDMAAAIMARMALRLHLPTVPRPRLRMAGTVGMVAKAKPRKGTRPRKVDILRPMDLYITEIAAVTTTIPEEEDGRWRDASLHQRNVCSL